MFDAENSSGSDEFNATIENEPSTAMNMFETTMPLSPVASNRKIPFAEDAALLIKTFDIVRTGKP